MMLILPLLLTTFVDVAPTAEYAAAVTWAADQSIVEGYADGTFRPDAAVNRAELFHMLMPRNLGCDMQILAVFDDLDPTAWYAPAVCAALETGIARGHADGTFRPADGVTLAESLVVVQRLNPALAPRGTNPHATCDQWWCDALHWAGALGSVPATVDTVHAPLTRAQVTQVLHAVNGAQYTYTPQNEFLLISSPNANAYADVVLLYPPGVPTVIDSDLTFAQAVAGSPAPPQVLATQELVDVTYHGFDGAVHAGQIMVHRDVADDVRAAFAAAFEEGFLIEAVIPASQYDWDDDVIMAANVTSGFNYRLATGLDWVSHHGYGYAIDVNPRLNAYFLNDLVLPPNGTYVPGDPGVITPQSAFLVELAARGWSWGGYWATPKDYHHFQILPEGYSKNYEE